MAVVDELVTLIGYQIDARGEAALRESKKHVIDMTKKVAALAVAVIAGRTAFQGWIHGIIDHSMQMQRLSDDTGISTNALQQWGYAAERMGGDAKGALSNLQAFQRGLHSVVPGQFNQGLALQLPQYLSGQVKTLEQVLELLSDKYSKLAAQGPEGKLQAFRFGNLAGLNDDNIRVLLKGREGVRELMDQFTKLGGGIGTEAQVSANAKLWQSLLDLKTAAKGYASQIGNELTPYIQKAVDWTVEWIKQNRELHASQVKLASQKMGQAPEEAKGWWERFKDAIFDAGVAERKFFSDLGSHYPHITAWLQNMGLLAKNMFLYVGDDFSRVWSIIKTDGLQILRFFSDVGDSITKIFKAGGWLLDKFMQLTGQGYTGPGLGQKAPEQKQPTMVNPWQTFDAQRAGQTVNHYKVEMRIDGSKEPTATGVAVKDALNAYFFNPQKAY